MRWFSLVLTMHAGVSMSAPRDKFATRHTDRPVVVAHRGASALAPENTLASIRLAASLGVSAVEFDVHRSADGIPVVIHDSGLARTTNGRGLVRKQSFEALQQLSAGEWFGSEFRFEKIPSLAQAIRAAGTEMILCIEIKTAEPILKSVFGELEEAGAMGRTVMFSFKSKQIETSKRLRPEIPALLLIDPGPEKHYDAASIMRKARAVHADLVGLDHSVVNRTLVRKLQEQGLPVFVYTVNEGSAVQRVVQFGVDGVISDRPRATMSRVYRLRPPLK